MQITFHARDACSAGGAFDVRRARAARGARDARGARVSTTDY